MLINHIHIVVAGMFDGGPVQSTEKHRHDHRHFGVFHLDGFAKFCVVVAVDRRGMLVADLDVFRPERFGVARLRPHGTPAGVSWANGVFDGVERAFDTGTTI
jgi:hypothetical protein